MGGVGIGMGGGEMGGSGTGESAGVTRRRRGRRPAGCTVRYLGSVLTEALTGPRAVALAADAVLGAPPPPPCTAHFHVSARGITLTDRQRRWGRHSHCAVQCCIGLYRAIQRYTVPYSAIQCYIELYSAVQGYTVLYRAIQCCTGLYSAIQCHTVPYSAIQCHTVLYSAVQCYTVPYSAI